MASTTGPDMTTARAAVEALMDDACIATIDPQGAKDDTLDPVTGYLTKPSPDSNTIYSASTLGFEGRSLADEELTGGKCKIKPASQSEIAQEQERGGVVEGITFYTVGFPWDAPKLPRGSHINFVSSRRDPLLVGLDVMVRRDASVGTFNVSRKYLCEMRSK